MEELQRLEGEIPVLRSWQRLQGLPRNHKLKILNGLLVHELQ